jgi:DNA-binding XRE family transcriptional regulator
MTDEELYKFIGLRIKSEREDLEMSQAKLAEHLELTRTSVSNIENGQQKIQLHTLFQIAKVFGIPVLDLLPVSGHKAFVGQRHLKKLSPSEREWVKSFLVTVSGEGNSREQVRSNLAVEVDPERLLHKVGILEPPIPVDKIAQRYGVSIQYAPYDGEIAGLLFNGGEKAIIGVNSLHSKVRQRFAIAHELGHLALHRTKELHFDRNFSAIKGYGPSSKVDSIESEANKFAIELLMPVYMLKTDLKGKQIDFSSSDFIGGLADRYKVGLEVMTHRLTMLDAVTGAS